MSDWKEIKRPFREALIGAFNRDRLAIVLQYHCDRRLDRITSKSASYDKNVDDVLADAERNGWLQKLAAGALTENETHSGLQATVPPILAGIEAEGNAYYQGEPFQDPGQSGEPRSTISDPGSGKNGDSQDLDTRQLHQQLVDQFNLEELRTLCFTLGIDPDDLGGNGKSAMARELVLYMERRGQSDRLHEAIQQQRG